MLKFVLVAAAIAAMPLATHGEDIKTTRAHAAAGNKILVRGTLQGNVFMEIELNVRVPGGKWVKTGSAAINLKTFEWEGKTKPLPPGVYEVKAVYKFSVNEQPISIDSNIKRVSTQRTIAPPS